MADETIEVRCLWLRTDYGQSERQSGDERARINARYAGKMSAERDHFRAALAEIAARPTVERNPDGEDQAAHTMQLIAREALGMEGS